MLNCNTIEFITVENKQHVRFRCPHCNHIWLECSVEDIAKHNATLISECPECKKTIDASGVTPYKGK